MCGIWLNKVYSLYRRKKLFDSTYILYKLLMSRHGMWFSPQHKHMCMQLPSWILFYGCFQLKKRLLNSLILSSKAISLSRNTIDLLRVDWTRNTIDFLLARIDCIEVFRYKPAWVYNPHNPQQQSAHRTDIKVSNNDHSQNKIITTGS